MTTFFIIFMTGIFSFAYLAIRKHFKEKTDALNVELDKTKNELATASNSLVSINVEFKEVNSELSAITQKVERLSKYEKIVDAEQEAKRIIDEANAKYIEKTKLAETKLELFNRKAAEAAEKAHNLERTANAFKNIINGYGDDYLIPTRSLLDELAQDYDHLAAGVALKEARDFTRMLIKIKEAAECSYVEPDRKESAINFVVDAFNGKVDSILSSAKEGNYGTLSQKINDAYHLVNSNGSAFRNARIKQKYLDARLEELKRACIVIALKQKEKEEQQEIKAKLREEEKAIRDYEKALKEAQKDQETAEKAIEKVKKDMEAASESKRQFYEEKLKDLENKLSQAEEKNKRAQSMAELTKSGHVYIISNIGSFGDDVLKIGMTRRLDPMDRVWELGDASVPFEFDVHAMIYSEDAPSLEKELHHVFSKYQVNKINTRKEFFKVGLLEIKNEIEKRGLSVHWTMTAEAREFRESRAIESEKLKQAA